MGTLEQILTIGLGLVILDFVLLGSIAYIFRLSLPYRSLLKGGVLLRDTPCNLAPYFHRGSGRFGELILTESHLILRDTWLTSSCNLDVTDIKQYMIKGTLTGKSKIVMFLNIGGDNDRLSFKTKNGDNWREVLERLEIKEMT